MNTTKQNRITFTVETSLYVSPLWRDIVQQHGGVLYNTNYEAVIVGDKTIITTTSDLFDEGRYTVEIVTQSRIINVNGERMEFPVMNLYPKQK